MFETVWLRVAGIKCNSCRAQMSGFQRKAVKGQVYPVLIPGAKNDKVDGIIYLEVNDDIIPKLDRFEGQAYKRRKVQVEINDGSKIPAQAYILKKAFFPIIEDRTWDQQQFAERSIKDFPGEDV